MIRVIDASVALKWFLAEDRLRREALSILEEIKGDPREFVVPELFFNEMLSAFCRIVRDAKLIHGYMDDLQALGLARLGNGRDVLAKAASLAVRHGITGYDAIYAANASLVGGTWLTADLRAHRKITALRISRFIGDITPRASSPQSSLRRFFQIDSDYQIDNSRRKMDNAKAKEIIRLGIA